jgi:glycosyltransferase involved in cell wall biosynthesis
MRILQITEDFRAIGGIQELVEQVSNELIALGHHVAIVSTPYVTPGAERIPSTRAECTYVEIPGRKVISMRHPERIFRQPIASELIAQIHRWRPDVVNSHLWTWDKFMTVADAAQRSRVPLVQSLYDSWGQGKLGRGALRSLRRAAALTALSQATRAQFAAIARTAKHAHVMLAGVDLAAAEAAVPYARIRPYIFCAARLDLRHKAIDLLIEAFAAITSDFPEVDLLIAGAGPDRDRLDAEIRAADLGQRIELLGARPRDELWSLYKGARFFAMPSRMPEGLGLVFLESMACGRPVIATRSGGTPEIVGHRDNGLLLESDDRGRWADALCTLLVDDGLCKAMGVRGHAIVRERFTWRAVALRHLGVYEAVV